MENKQTQVLKIPKKRIAVVIGTSGETKKELQEKTNTKINVTEEGEVEIQGDPFDAWITKKIIKAIGRGFSPRKALLLLNEGYMLEVIELNNWAKTEKSRLRLKGRVIGTEGKSKRTIEEISQTYISVYGKTICIIGGIKNVLLAKRAVEMLLSGCKHTTIYNLLEKEQRKMRKEEILGG